MVASKLAKSTPRQNSGELDLIFGVVEGRSGMLVVTRLRFGFLGEKKPHRIARRGWLRKGGWRIGGVVG